MLLVHGFGGAAGAWGRGLLEALAARRQLLAVDLIGHGASGDPSGPERVRTGPVLDDLERCLDAAGVTACDWIGYSMGGRLALAAALERPHRVGRLVLESASPGLATEAERAARREQDERLAAALVRDGVAAWVERWESSPLFARRRALDARVLEPFLELRRANRADALAAWLRGLGTGAQPSYWERLGELAMPALLLTGAEDARFGAVAQAMERRIPRARHVAIPGAGHTVHLEAPAAWLDAVGAFLDEPTG